MRFRPYFLAEGICDNGITGVGFDSHGNVVGTAACGVEGTVGLSGTHNWKLTTLGLSYTGDYRHYTQASFYDGTDQSLSLGLTHQPSKRTAFNLMAVAGVYTRNYSTVTAGGFYDPTALPTPGPAIFDNQTTFGSARAGFTFLKSARWSFNMGGGAFLARYRSDALYGATSYMGQADAVYRYSRFGTIGFAYEFDHTFFTRVFGASDVHTASMIYALRMSATWEFQLRGGASRVESLLLQAVAVDPVVAEITGQTSGIIAAYRLNYLPSVGANISKAFHQANLSFGYSRGISAGNGVYLTSNQEMAMANYTYTGLRKWNVGLNVNYTKLSGLIQNAGTYESYAAGFGVTRSLRAGLHGVMEVDARRYNLGTTFNPFKRDNYRATVGLGWSPGELPLSLF